MHFFILGFFTGLSLILAIGAQNVFVIEQGLKKEHIFIVCFICALSDAFLIFLGIFLFFYFANLITQTVEIILNILLILFLIFFIWKKFKEKIHDQIFNTTKENKSLLSTIFKTLGFTFINPHVYSDTVFFLGNFSKDFLINQKFFFSAGASLSSFVFFFTIGYLSRYLSQYLKNAKIWKIINYLIIFFMFGIIFFILINLF